jgi:hypothetical protein
LTLRDLARMPKLPRGAEQTVFFLFGLDPRTGKMVGPHGTGLFLTRESSRVPNCYHLYAVTNWHVACRGSSIIAFNTLDAHRRFIELGPEDWLFTNQGDDLAAVDITDHHGLNDNVLAFSEKDAVTPDIIERFDIGPGEDVYMCGLFASHHTGSIWGDKDVPVNVPAFRFGNISMLADDAAPVKLETGALRPSFLVDMRSRTGFSGSPVIVYRTIGSNLQQIPGGWDPKRWESPKEGPGRTFSLSDPDDMFVGLLGVHCGQFWDTVKAFKTKSSSEQLGDSIKDGDEIDIQSSMNIVAPAWCITELLNLEEFEMARKQRDEKFAQDARRRPNAESAQPSPPASDANPNHREDFKRLEVLAVKKPARED